METPCLHPSFDQPISSSSLGLGLIGPNIVESSMMKCSPPSSPSETCKITNNIGFIHDTGSEESLIGFEISDERRVNVNDHNIHQEIHSDDDDGSNKNLMNGDWSRRRSRIGGEWRKVVRSFPPPLKSLNRNGEPCFFLRPLRKDGRLELTKVRIRRPESLHASRYNGRLTLHLVSHHHNFDKDTEEEETIQEEEDDDEQEQEVVELN